MDPGHGEGRIQDCRIPSVAVVQVTSMTQFARKSLPASVARLLRQEAGFGCCACGKPIIEYHHIVPWAADRHYRADDMMALCPYCHATVNALSEAEQRKLKANPYNITRGWAEGPLQVNHSCSSLYVGGTTVHSHGPFLTIDGEPIVALYRESGRLEISLKLYGENDELLLFIERNEWISGDPLPWDIQVTDQTITVRQRAGKISLGIDARQNPMRLTGQFWKARRWFVCTASDGILTEGANIFPKGGIEFWGNIQLSKDGTVILDSDCTILLTPPPGSLPPSGPWIEVQPGIWVSRQPE